MSTIDLSQARVLFFTEAREMCDHMDAALLALESDPRDRETLDALFRAAHTIKGSAGMFGLVAVVGFMHFVETVLDRLREGAVGFDGPLCSLLLACGDHARRLLDRHEADGEEAQPTAEESEASAALEARLTSYLPGSAAGNAGAGGMSPVGSARDDSSNRGPGEWHVSVRFAEATFRDGFDPLSVIAYLGSVFEITHIRLISDEIPLLEALEPESCYLHFEIGLTGVGDKEDIEAAFEFVREDCELRMLPPVRTTQAILDVLSKDASADVRPLGEILVECGAISRPELESVLALQEAAWSKGEERRLGEVIVESRIASPAVVEAAIDHQARAKAAKSEDTRHVRVRADKLDALINLVGELVIAGAGATIQARRARDGALIESTAAMGRLIEEIRNGALALRMVPIGETFSRFRRVVRDVAADLGKEVALELSGTETELDKSVVERIGDPLMHLVRNALDHGLEAPEEREGAGKPRAGTLRLAARHDSGAIVIRIEDDGRGIRRDRVRAKAEEKGLIAKDAVLTDAEIDQLIFAPGFSTAERVTDLSGRGVGMDVVRQNIESLRGTVQIESAPGAGTSIEIRLPLTLAIIDGFLVRVGESSFVVPLDQVDECIDGQVCSGATPSGETTGTTTLRGHPLPVIHLHALFGIAGEPAARPSVVVVGNGTQRLGLLVDQLLGEFQTVIKPLGQMFRHVRGIAGSTILGSGEVALILDVASLSNLAAESSGTVSAGALQA